MRLPKVVGSALADRGIALDLMRIYLGIGLFVRGALFVAQPQVLVGYLNTGNQWLVPVAVSHYVAAAHICGGILLALGLGTRVAALLQLPPLIGAVFFVHFGEGLLGAGQSLEFSALVLAMLLVFCVFGSGRLSLDAVLGERVSGEPDGSPPRAAPGPRRPVGAGGLN